ncbi:MAG: GvpL/GvpF family gas vesicle protein [Flammeovirgaceae bacterium]
METHILSATHQLVSLVGVTQKQYLAELRTSPLEAIEFISTDTLIGIGKWVSVPASSDLESLGNDMDWLTTQAIAHDQLLCTLSELGTVIPIKLGAFFSSKEALYQELQDQQDRFHKQLAFLENQEEWSLKAHIDPSADIPDGAAFPELAAIEQQLAHASKGMAYLLQKKYQKQKTQLFRNKQIEMIQQLIDRIQQFSTAMTTINPQRTDKKMLLHQAILLLTPNRELFLQTINDMVAALKLMGIELIVHGPLPSYHFVDHYETDNTAS